MIIDSATHQYEGVVFNVLTVDTNSDEWRSDADQYIKIGSVANFAFVIPEGQFAQIMAKTARSLERNFLYGSSAATPRGILNDSTV